jgi:hypothetical protein
MLDLEFLKIAEKLKDPLSGTEIMAPLLYYLVRSTRPEHALEFGAGYSTLFILKGLADNLSHYKSEIQALRSKNSSFSKSLSTLEFDLWFDDKNAPFYNPKYYMKEYKPQLICFEKLPKNHSYTQKVLDVIKELDLYQFLTFIEGSPCGQSIMVPKNWTAKIVK